MGRKYQVISADGHVETPPVWTKYVPEQWQDRAPRSNPITADVPGDTDLGFVMNQDVGIMKTAQRGLHQPGLKHLALSAEECRVINLHRNLDEWCGA